jgi:hypothetical protein
MENLSPWPKQKFDGFVKSPSAALRFTPQFLRAWHGRGTLRVPDIGREASRPYNQNHRSGDFYEIIKNDNTLAFCKAVKSPFVPLFKGGKEESFIEGLQKSSPPFEKGRTGGIYEPPFQKTKLIQK